MDPLDVVQLAALMRLTEGRAETRVALVDGPANTSHPDLSDRNIRGAALTSTGARRRALVPPLLDAWAACQTLLAART